MNKTFQKAKNITSYKLLQLLIRCLLTILFKTNILYYRRISGLLNYRTTAFFSLEPALHATSPAGRPGLLGGVPEGRVSGGLVGQAVMVAVFGIAGGLVELFAGDAAGGVAGEAGRGRVAAGYAVLAGGGAGFAGALLNVGVAFFGAGATGAGRSQQRAGYSQRTEGL